MTLQKKNQDFIEQRIKKVRGGSYLQKYLQQEKMQWILKNS